MSIRKIVHYPATVLLRPTSPVNGVDDSVRALVQDMIETMHAAPGVGLAANQVGVGLRVAVIDLSVGEKPEELRVLINPTILEARGREVDEEGCLSVPGFTESVLRPTWVRVEASDLEGRRYEIVGEGLLARAIVHELDHLDGRLYLHRLSSLKRERLKKKIQRAIEQGEWAPV
ncbi:MAG: peptide deformylase [Acidobacteriota bacterium]